jgi:hypothetical protein
MKSLPNNPESDAVPTTIFRPYDKLATELRSQLGKPSNCVSHGGRHEIPNCDLGIDRIACCWLLGVLETLRTGAWRKASGWPRFKNETE